MSQSNQLSSKHNLNAIFSLISLNETKYREQEQKYLSFKYGFYDKGLYCTREILIISWVRSSLLDGKFN